MEHMKFYNTVDLCLDPFPYTGGTSPADALLMGIPVVTLKGKTLRERLCANLLHTIGKSEWVVDSIPEYLDKELDLASQAFDLSQKKKLRSEFLDSELCDGKDLTRHLETAYIDILESKGILGG